MPRPPKETLVPYEDNRPDLDVRFKPHQAPASIDFGRKLGAAPQPRREVRLTVRRKSWERAKARAERQGLRINIVLARLMEAYGDRELDLQPHPSGIKIVPHRTTFMNADNPSNR